LKIIIGYILLYHFNHIFLDYFKAINVSALSQSTLANTGPQLTREYNSSLLKNTISRQHVAFDLQGATFLWLLI